MADVRLPSLNLVLLAGRATADPDLRYTPKGTAVLQFQIAVNRRYLDRTANEWKEDPSFFTVVVWSEQAERVGEKIKKGSAVMVEGELRSRTWDDKEGRKRTVVEVHARRVQTLDRSGAGRGDYSPAGSDQPEPNSTGPDSGSDQLDDIPF